MAKSTNGSFRAKKKQAEELLLAKRLPEARAAFAQLCQLDPRDYDAWLNLGAIEGMLGKLNAAEEAFKKALVLRKDEARIYFNLARLCDLQERIDEAFNYWLAYLRLKPDDADGYAQLGKLLHKAGQSDKAVDNTRLPAGYGVSSYTDRFCGFFAAEVLDFRGYCRILVTLKGF